MKKILFVDNDPDFLATRAEFLERAGFHVYKAMTLVDAEEHLSNGWVHLAVLDVRMMDDDDEKDFSGMTLINADFTQAITKIVLTSFNTPQIRDFVRAVKQTQPLMLDVIEKADGPDALIAVVSEAFTRHIRINWNLTIDWKARDSFSLIKLIEPGIEGERVINRAEEFEDLFRRLFYEKDHIRIERLLWWLDGRIALVVFAFKEGQKPESHIVVCGKNEIVNKEAERFKEFAPKVPGDSGVTLGEKMCAETTHFAANAYTFANCDLENVQTLIDLYRLGPERTFNAALNSLYQFTLKGWHQEKLIRETRHNLQDLYIERLHLADALSQQYLEERVKVVETQIPTLKVNIERAEGKLTARFNTGSFTYPDPILNISQLIETNQPVLLITVLGTLSGDNILTDATGRTWLTDFAEAGSAPQFWNFVSLEAAIRFDWVDTSDLLRRHEMENSLINTDFAKPDTRDLESVVGKPTRAIATVRKLSAREVGKDTLNYHLGIFCHAMRRLADLKPDKPLMPNDLARFGHLLLSMAMIAEKFEQSRASEQSATPAGTEKILGVDEKARRVLIGDRKIRLSPQPFEVFMLLYRHANEVCTKKEILEVALSGNFDESYLPTLIGRIRQAIEDDPKHPRFLITEPNAGYRLILDPK